MPTEPSATPSSEAHSPPSEEAPTDLYDLVVDFCRERQDVLDAVLPRKAGASDASRQVTARRRQRAFVVEVGYAEASKALDIPLLSNGDQTAGLMIEYFLTLDHRGRYLAVEQSSFTLRSGRHPVVRLDFRNDMHTAPAAHWNIHAERAAVTRMLTRNDPESSGELSTVHIPVGGARMRPCLEDVLELIAVDFKFDVVDGWPEVLSAGRERWRRLQIASLVRDVPEEAARVLIDLGYNVAGPEGEIREGRRRDRTLRRW